MFTTLVPRTFATFCAAALLFAVGCTESVTDDDSTELDMGTDDGKADGARPFTLKLTSYITYADQANVTVTESDGSTYMNDEWLEGDVTTVSGASRDTATGRMYKAEISDPALDDEEPGATIFSFSLTTREAAEHPNDVPAVPENATVIFTRPAGSLTWKRLSSRLFTNVGISGREVQANQAGATVETTLTLPSGDIEVGFFTVGIKPVGSGYTLAAGTSDYLVRWMGWE